MVQEEAFPQFQRDLTSLLRQRMVVPSPVTMKGKRKGGKETKKKGERNQGIIKWILYVER